MLCKDRMSWLHTCLRTQFLAAFCFTLAIASPSASRDRIPLDGVWLFRLDPQDLGIHQRWFQDQFTTEVSLPGVTQLFFCNLTESDLRRDSPVG